VCVCVHVHVSGCGYRWLCVYVKWFMCNLKYGVTALSLHLVHHSHSMSYNFSNLSVEQ